MQRYGIACDRAVCLLRRCGGGRTRHLGALLAQGIAIAGLLADGVTMQVCHMAAYASRSPTHRKLRLQPLPPHVFLGSAQLCQNTGVRPTMPLRAARPNRINLSMASTYGTATAVWLACRFLDAGKAGYDNHLAHRNESLPDVLHSVGPDVWAEHNSGCKWGAIVLSIRRRRQCRVVTTAMAAQARC